MKKTFRNILVIPLLSLLVFAVSYSAQPNSSVTEPIKKNENFAAFAASKSIEDWRNTPTAEQYNTLY